MIPVMCLVQEGQISPAVEYLLKHDINVFSQRAFGEDADIDWIEVPIGNGFTAAAPSSSIVLSVLAKRVLGPVERLALLKELGGLCVRGAGLPAKDTLVALRDP